MMDMAKWERLPKYDSAEFLNTPERQAAYLSLVFEDGTPDEIRDALRTVARARGMTDIARAAGISREGLYKALGENGNPEFGTVLRLVRAMGMTISTHATKRPARKRARAA